MKTDPDTAAEAASASSSDPQWYCDAVIYELHVKAFHDSNADGIGDFRGLTDKLDYIAELGVNTIWVLPFYPSPFRDDGYDVSDYHNVHPAYGTRQDFRTFVREAHRRNLRVITELVVNHTSDQHPWFQSARRAPRGSPKRDYYVWSDSPDRYAGTRIIFTDSETSNWAWDEVAQQYYWHRFFSHQPDLNFDNRHVRQAVFRVMRFWLDMGVDGFRLDAIPYLVEREGTSNENLQPTHAVIKEIRAQLDARYRNRMLLAEANMWPEDVREYFGNGDECHMAYHFPLMPRMYMAIAQEDRSPIVEIMQQTPDIPPGCQWSIFLRNHDELTLEMVTSQERDYMYRMYAEDRRARVNLGIRRRLAPLMENDRDRIKLMNSLLLSMPGSPTIYYGDEIGMGDNIYLGDRDGVRTPMQWTGDRNGGFSRADPQRLYLPPIQDPVYGYESINVESQSRTPASLLNWMRRMLAVRRSSRAFGRGKLVFLHPGNRKVLAYLREFGDEVLLCVANLGRTAQPVELDLARHLGRVPIELIGRTTFPPIGALPYLLTLPGHGFYWFRLATDVPAPAWHVDVAPPQELPVLVLFDGFNSLFRERVMPWRIGLAERIREQFETTILPNFLQQQRWFGTKAGKAERARLVDDAVLEWRGHNWLLTLGAVRGVHEAVHYFLPLGLLWEDRDDERLRALAPARIAKVRQQAQLGALVDALADAAFCAALVQAIGERREVAAHGGTIRFLPTAAFHEIVGPEPEAPQPVRLQATSNNSVALIGERLFLKVYRRVRDGINPEVEIGRYLTESASFDRSVPVAGSIDYVAADGRVATLALLQKFRAHQGDAWQYTVEYLGRHLEAQGTRSASDGTPAHGAFLTLVRTLGERTAQLHGALARSTGDASFEPEPLTAADVQAWAHQAMDNARLSLRLLSERIIDLPASLQEEAAHVLESEQSLIGRIERCAAARPVGAKTRIHGDYHLGQVLLALNDFLVIDFEGDAGRPLAERRRKESALRDVAGMLRSFSGARHATMLHAGLSAAESRRLAPLARLWEDEVRTTFLQAYGQAAAGLGVLGADATLDDAGALLELFELDKAFADLRHDLQNRPDWVGVSLAGIVAAARETRAS